MHEDSRKYFCSNERRKSRDHFTDYNFNGEDDSSSQNEDDASDYLPPIKKSKISSEKSTEKSSREQSNYSLLPLEWSPMSFGDALGKGRIGNVVEYLLNGEYVALKLVNSLNVKSYKRELDIYHRLEEFQGICVPKIYLECIESPSKMLIGFAMQLLDKLPTDWQKWTLKQRFQAKEVLRTIACTAYIKHNDIRPQNFGSLGDVVFLLDFEDVSLLKSSEINRYIKEIDAMFVTPVPA